MRVETTYIAADGTRFSSKEACLSYEQSCVLLDPKHIQFYTNDGYLIENPNEDVLLDSNRFIAYTYKGLFTYIIYCENHHIDAPPQTLADNDFPRHYYYDKDWKYIEMEQALRIASMYKNIPVPANQPAHNLVTKDN